MTSPYTIYSMEVIDNLKGRLKKNITFNVTKKGGISEDGDTLDDLINYYNPKPTQELQDMRKDCLELSFRDF